MAAMDEALQSAVRNEEKKLSPPPSSRVKAIAGATRSAAKSTPSVDAGHYAAFFPSPSPPQTSSHELPAPVAQTAGHDSTPRRSAWKTTKAATPVRSPAPTRQQPQSPTTAFTAGTREFSPVPAFDQDGEVQLDRQLALLSKFLASDKSALRIQQLRERTKLGRAPPN